METRDEKLEKFLSALDTEIEILNHVNVDEITDFYSLLGQIEKSGGFDIDVIYYSAAMEYLTNNDTSLRESMALATDLGFTPENINSELLASLLASQNARHEFEELESEITDFLDNLDRYAALLEDLEADEENLVSLQENPATPAKDIAELQRAIDETITELNNF